MTFSALLTAHHDAVAASVVGGTAGAAAAAGALPIPPDAPWWAAWLGALGVSLAPFVLSRLLAAAGAFPRALAEAREARARSMLNDKTPTNDDDAARLLDEAAQLRAVAAAIDAASRNGVDRRKEDA
jgi:hypothetical protein